MEQEWVTLSFDEIADLEVGDNIFELAMGYEFPVKIASEIVISEVEIKAGDDRKQLRFTGNVGLIDGTTYPQKFVVTEGMSHYGPTLYRKI